MASSKMPIIINCGKTMFSYRFGTFLKSVQSIGSIKCRHFSTENTTAENKERDPAPFFFNEEVQKLLMSMTGRNYQKIFRRRKDSSKLASPEYKFMTDQQLKEAMEKAERKATKLLQMPPVVKTRPTIDKVLSKDPALQGHDTAKLVITDITFGIENHDRLIAVRETNGTLRLADWDERQRMNQIYFPVEGREITMPKMFDKEYLEDLFSRKEYIFILDRACIQMDPDDPKYQEVCQSTYEYVDKNGDYEILKSTRHFGPMVFHLVWNKNISNLFLHNIKTENIEDNVSLIQLYRKLHSDINYDNLQIEDNVKFVEEFAKQEFSETSIIPALQAYKEVMKERKELEKNIKKAHGLEE